MVVIAIMAVLASIGLPMAELSQRRNKEEELRTALRQIRSALDEYKRMVDLGRIVRPADGSGYPRSLKVLVDGQPLANSPQDARLYFLRRIPRDPMASGDIKDPIETWGTRSYASPPGEPSAGRDVYDVYSKSTGSGMNGPPYRQW